MGRQPRKPILSLYQETLPTVSPPGGCTGPGHPDQRRRERRELLRSVPNRWSSSLGDLEQDPRPCTASCRRTEREVPAAE